LPSDIPSIAKNPTPALLVAAVLVCAAVLRVWLALHRPLQVDEAYSLHLAALPLLQGLRAVAALDVHPPLFLLITHALTSMHVPDFAIRLATVATGVAGVWLFYGVVRAWHGEQPALIAAGFAAFMPALVFYDTMIRMYAPFNATAMVSFLLLSFLYTRSDLTAGQRRAAWCAWTLACAVMIWLLYLGFLVIAAQLGYAAIVRRDGLVRSLIGGAAACVAWLPQLPTFLGQLPRGGLAFPFYAQHQLAAFFELPGQATIAVQSHGAGVLVVAASVFAWLWIAFAIGFGLRGSTRSLATWLAVPACLTLLYSVAGHKLLYADRYYLLFAYGLSSLTAVGLVRLVSVHKSEATLASVALGSVVLALGCAYTFNSHLYTADWPGAAALLSGRAPAHDLIVMEQGSSYFPLERGPALDHHPLVLVFHRSDVSGSLRLATPFARIWLVLYQAGPVDPQLELLQGLTRTHGVAGEWEFVRWLPAESATVLLLQSKHMRKTSAH
jgi:Dolichyl-phosphate-mannose-protein mannosyltransferase